MTDFAILQSRLGEAESTYHLLMTGNNEVSVNIDGYGAITYQNADAPKLEIRRKQGGSGRKAIYVEF